MAYRPELPGINNDLIAMGLVVGQDRNKKGQWTSDRILVRQLMKNRSFSAIMNLLLDGPCEVEFNRVYSKRGFRKMRCIKPTISPKNAFDPRFPTLIAVRDLDILSETGKEGWRSFYYEQLHTIKRLLPEELNDQQRFSVEQERGPDYDFLFPSTTPAFIPERRGEIQGTANLDSREIRTQPTNVARKKVAEDNIRRAKGLDMLSIQSAGDFIFGDSGRQ